MPNKTSTKSPLKVVVRITTEKFFTSDGAYREVKTMRTLKRKSTGCVHDLMDDIDYPPINLNAVADGVYELDVTNVSLCHETGVVDDWDLILKEYKEG